MPKFEREVEIDAPVEKVWEVMTNPNLWPQWFPGVVSGSDVKSTSQAGKFEWTIAGHAGTGSIVNVEPMRRLEMVTQIGDDKDSHVFTLQESGGGFLGLGDDECKVHYTLDTLVGGGIFAQFIAGGNPKDMLRVKKTLHMLRKLVESQ